MSLYYFPSQNKHVFKTIDEEKNEVENSFKFFLENTLKSVGVGEGCEECGAEKGKKYFVLKIGKIVSLTNEVNNS